MTSLHHSWVRAARSVTAGTAILFGFAFGCTARSEIDVDDRSDPFDVEPPERPEPRSTTTSKVDLLLVVDNSRDMASPQRLLSDTLPYLLRRLTAPQCVNGLGNVLGEPVNNQCELGEIDFPAIEDLHIGVISTSLGGLGSDACPESIVGSNDRAQLLSRNTAGGVVPTYDNQDFLWWDPGGEQVPKGEQDGDAIEQKLDAIVGGVGATGCGFESQLESIYRFLVDPAPYETLELDGQNAVPQGVDDLLLRQRRDFLRPDSAVVVLLITEEDDCSTRANGPYYVSRQGVTESGVFHLVPGRPECETDVNDPCCASCASPTPEGCPAVACNQPLSEIEDPLNLRCFDQKRRFGVDFLYPLSRYIDGFSEYQIPDANGQMVENPLFAGGRGRELFVFAGIVGVPWQDIAYDSGDLSTGYLPTDRIQWDWLLGQDDAPPVDPLMIPSVDPRVGVNPATSAPLAPPDAASPSGNAINGHERIIAARDDLQHVCIYPLRTPIDCEVSAEGCGCTDDPNQTDPRCQSPDGTYSSTQRFARAVPAPRQLTVMRALGERAVVASLCPSEVEAPNQPTFAYRPAVDALMRTIRRRIQQ